jgi:lipocalin
MKYGTVYAVTVERVYTNGRVVRFISSIYTSYNLAKESLINEVNDCVNSEVAKGKLKLPDNYDNANLVIEFAEGGNYREKCTCIYRITKETIFTEFKDDIEWNEI